MKGGVLQVPVGWLSSDFPFSSSSAVFLFACDLILRFGSSEGLAQSFFSSPLLLDEHDLSPNGFDTASINTGTCDPIYNYFHNAFAGISIRPGFHT
jgi:hypothetical protein